MEERPNSPSRRKFLEVLVGTAITAGVALANPRTSYSANTAKTKNPQSNLDSYIQTDIDRLIANGDVYLNAGATKVKRVQYPKTDEKYNLRIFPDAPVDRRYNLDKARARYGKAINLSLSVDPERERIARNKLLAILEKLFTLPKGEIDENYRNHVRNSLIGNLTALRATTPSYQERLTYDQWL